MPPIAIFSHGVLEATGFIFAIAWFIKIAQKRHFHLEFIVDHFFSLAVFSLLGARIGYAFVFFSKYLQNPLSFLYFWDGGYLLWPGIVAFLITLYYHCNQQKEKIGQWLDIIVPAGVIAFIFDAFGAFLGGNQYGKPTELSWGITYENPEVPFTIPIHPVQLYLLIAYLLLLIILQALHKKHLRESLVGFIGLSLFAFFSFVMEYLRGDEMVIYLGLRFTQILELFVVIFSLSFLVIRKRA